MIGTAVALAVADSSIAVDEQRSKVVASLRSTKFSLERPSSSLKDDLDTHPSDRSDKSSTQRPHLHHSYTMLVLTLFLQLSLLLSCAAFVSHRSGSTYRPRTDLHMGGKQSKFGIFSPAVYAAKFVLGRQMHSSKDLP